VYEEGGRNYVNGYTYSTTFHRSAEVDNSVVQDDRCMLGIGAAGVGVVVAACYCCDKETSMAIVQILGNAFLPESGVDGNLVAQPSTPLRSITGYYPP